MTYILQVLQSHVSVVVHTFLRCCEPLLGLNQVIVGSRNLRLGKSGLLHTSHPQGTVMLGQGTAVRGNLVANSINS